MKRMKKIQKKRLNNRKKMDYRRKLNNQKKINNPHLTQNELRKRQYNESVWVKDYPQREDVPNLPLPVDVSISLKLLEARMFNQIDEFFPMSSREILTKVQYTILCGGVKNNMTQLQMNEEIWNNLKSYSEQFAAGKYGQTFNLGVAINYRIHLEALRMITGKSLMDILHEGEIYLQNEFDEVDNEFYRSVCRKIEDLLWEDHYLDITRLTLKDLDKIHPAA
jgi:hypothetical protein